MSTRWAPEQIPLPLRGYTLAPDWMQAEADQARRRNASEELARVLPSDAASTTGDAG
jgi:hypothetical protein